MLYILNIIICCWYLSYVKVNTWREFWKFIPVILIWTFIAGGQDNIGADYKMYLYYFSHPMSFFKTRFEPLFAEITSVTASLGFPSQGPFYIFSAINIIVIFVGAKLAGVRNWAIFYFLLVVVSTIFNNQMNGLRQCVAVGFVFCAFIEIIDKRWLGVLLILIAGGFHYSALACIVFILMNPILAITSRIPVILLILAGISTFIDSGDTALNDYLLGNLPGVVSDNVHYADAYEGSKMGQATNIIYRLSKVMYIPIYFWSLILVKRKLLSEQQLYLFNLGFLSFFLRCILMLNQLLGRFSYYFWIPSIFPIYYLCSHYYKKRNWPFLIIILIYCSLSYWVKIIGGEHEYQHRFIYF